jgi:hypothetical protein
MLLLMLTLTGCFGGGSSSGGGGGGGGANHSVAARTAAIDPGDVDCPSGGVLVETGIDENGNGLLDTAEVDKSEKVCNGLAGANGLAALVTLGNERAGPNCIYGGIRIDSGLDANASGELDEVEISATDYICNGAPGADGSNWWDDLGATGALEGRVDRESGTPAEGAIVSIAGTRHYAFADGFGHYRFDYVAAGHHNITITLDGYTTVRLEDQPVTSNNTTTLQDVLLYKKRQPFPGNFSLANAKALVGQFMEDRSGQSMASAGDVNGDGYDDILIGAADADVGGNIDAGKSYLIYGRPGMDLGNVLSGDLALAADVIFTGESTDDYSGSAVAGAGDVNGDGYDDILIGAYRADPGGNMESGASYLIYGGPALSASVGLASADVTFTGKALADWSGRSVAGAGDVNGDGFDDILIGAFYASPGGNTRAGESYLIYGGASLPDSLSLAGADVVLSGVAADDQSGYSLAGAGDVNGDGYDDLLIGALGADVAGNADAGVSYLVYGGPALPAAVNLAGADVTLGGAAPSILSGGSVAGAGDVNGDGYDDILIGALYADPGGDMNAGESYLVYGGPALAESLSLADADAVFSGVAEDDKSGIAVAGAGDVNADGYDDFLIGAVHVDYGGNTDAGASYLVYGSSALPARLSLAEADVTLGGLAMVDIAGSAVAGAGDVNGDGYDDMLIGAPWVDRGNNLDAGASYLVMGRPRGVESLPSQLAGSRSNATADAHFMGANVDDSSGFSVAIVGDVNGDGFDDILVGAPAADPGGNAVAGESYLIYGRHVMDTSLALAMEADVTFEGVAAGDRSGSSIAGAGDVNGDGYDDIVIGAYRASPNGKSGAGASYLVFGGPTMPANLSLVDADVVLNGMTTGDVSGISVAGAGDVNGDGYDDILIGAYYADPGGNSEAGVSYLIYGGSTLPAIIELATANVTLSGAAAGDYSGVSVAGAGDVNGDGYDDILIGAYKADSTGNSSSGASYLVYGGLDLPTSLSLTDADVIFNGVAVNEWSGHSVAGAGDVNGDGYDDIIIGAIWADVGASTKAGASYLVYGGPGLSASISLAGADVILGGVATNDLSGGAVARAGDVNNDGYDDILIGATGSSPGGNASAGTSYLVYGGPALPVHLVLSDADAIFNGVMAGEYSGRSLSGGGDINGDGRSDILIGAYGADLGGTTNSGASYLFLGQGSRAVE